MPGAVEQIIGKEFPGQTAVEERTATVATAVAEVLRNDPERLMWLIVNTGSVIARVSWATAAGVANTIPIAADGGSLSVNVREDFVLPTHSLQASVGVGTTTLRITTVRRVSE